MDLPPPAYRHSLMAYSSHNFPPFSSCFFGVFFLFCRFGFGRFFSFLLPCWFFFFCVLFVFFSFLWVLCFFFVYFFCVLTPPCDTHQLRSISRFVPFRAPLSLILPVFFFFFPPPPQGCVFCGFPPPFACRNPLLPKINFFFFGLPPPDASLQHCLLMIFPLPP